MKVWNNGAKVQDLDKEIAFFEAIGGELVLDEMFNWEGEEMRVPLLRVADKYLHIMKKMVYEDLVDEPLANGLQHIVYEVDSLDEYRDRALRGGATETRPARRVEAGFGTRDVGIFRSPGGIRFEFIQVYEHAVPVLP